MLALCWVVAAGSTLWDRDEPRFARASVEMLESGNWMVPTFNGRLRPDKPVAIYWLMASSIRAFGQSEWAVRMWAGLGLATTVLLLGGFVRRHAPDADPVLAGVVVGLSPLAVVIGTVATTDGVLLALVTASMVVLGEGLLSRWTVARTVLLGVLLGGGLLVKGPVALAFPGLTAAGWVVLAAWRREPRWWTDAAAVVGATAVGCALFLAWGLPANAATGGELARIGLGHHVLERMSRPLESHGGGSVAYALYYPLVLLAGMLPFSALLPGGVAALWRERVGGARLRRFLALWILPPIVLFTLVATKLPHYILPVVPGLAVVLALGVAAAERDSGFAAGRVWRLGRWWLMLSGGLVATVLVAGAWLAPLPGLRPFGVGLAATVAVASVIGWRLAGRGRHRLTVLALGLAAVVVFLQLRAALPVVERVKPAPVVARAVRRATPPSAPVAAVGFTEPSLAFYLGRSFVELRPEGVGPWLAGNPGGVLIAETRSIAGQPLPACDEIVRVAGINLANGRRVEVVALRREAPASAAAPSPEP